MKPPKRDLRTIDGRELFGKLDERTQKRLRKAAKRGWPVQWFDGLSWEEGKPSFRPDDSYRLDPTFTPPAKRETFWISDNQVFGSKRAAIAANPHREPVKVREVKP